MLCAQMCDVTRKVCERARVPERRETLKIVEMGAGTGGTTRALLPMLASLRISVEYTLTDLSFSVVVSVQRLWGKTYPFVRFLTHDIEQAPGEHLRGAQMVLASNAVHATRNLVTPSTTSTTPQVSRGGGGRGLMSPVLCSALGIPGSNVVPFRSWIKRVRTSPLADAENSAGRQAMAGFLGAHFERMPCGGLVLHVERDNEYSVTMARAGPVNPELVVR